MLGYFHDDERTAAAFEGGWFHSGDLATIDDEGYITVVDRKKDMIKSGGENVASREVEEANYRLPQVSEVAVVEVPHPHWIDAGLDVEHREPARPGFAQLVVGPQHRGQRRDLGLAVQVPPPHLRQAPRQFAQHFHRHDRGTASNSA
jgi:acyl-CoA synthetase (AMP-forming)/AMP-acid ligase II